MKIFKNITLLFLFYLNVVCQWVFVNVCSSPYRFAKLNNLCNFCKKYADDEYIETEIGIT